MPDRAAQYWSDIIVACAAMLGGLVGLYRQWQRGEVKRVRAAWIVGELLTSAFAGLLAWLVCKHSGASFEVTAAACGIAGHMGGRAIAWAERAALRKAGAVLGDDGAGS